MKRIIAFLAFYTSLIGTSNAADTLQLKFASLLGKSDYESIRDITSDCHGNIYITGGTRSANFPTTANVFGKTFNNAGTILMDVFIMKFDSAGALIWSTLLGGPEYDRGYAIEVDTKGYVYVAGRAGANFPTTSCAFQTTFQGDNAPSTLYGPEDGFVAKISPDGSQLIWATYVGEVGPAIIRDIVVDKDGDVYAALTGVRSQCNFISSNAYQKTYQGSEDNVIAKISGDGKNIIWATYSAGSALEATPSIRVDSTKNVTILTTSLSTDIPISINAYDKFLNGPTDMWVGKYSSDGSTLIYGTYIGGSGDEWVETHQLALDKQGRAVIAAMTTSTDFPVTSGAVQTTYGGTGGVGYGTNTNYPGDAFVCVLSFNGDSVLSATYLGGIYGDGSEGIAIDKNNDILIGGATFSPNFPVTNTAQQSIQGGNADMYIAKLSHDLKTLKYASFIGGNDWDVSRSLDIDPFGNILFAGETKSSNYPTVNAFQPTHGGGVYDGGFGKFSLQHQYSNNSNCIIDSIFTDPCSTAGVLDGSILKSDPSFFPNPGNGLFTLQNLNINNVTIIFFNELGEKVAVKEISNQDTIDLRSFANGIYFYKIIDQKQKEVANGKICVHGN